MYQTLYDLKENPFSATADPEYFYLSTNHADAFSHLIYGIQQRKGILVVTGEIGTGKTTLCRTFLNRLDPTIKTALILNPYFSEMQLLQLIIKDLGIPGKFRNKLDLINGLNEFLLEETSHNHNVVVIIDEAQNLNIRQLEQIRLLSNLETEKTKLLQIILVGQPELLDKLRLSSLRQLNQRVAVRYHILPLGQEEIGPYIQHRLRVASRNSNGYLRVEFTPEALQAIYLHSHGTPRLINILCDRALLAGYVHESRVIDEKIIHKSAREIGQS